MGFRAKSGFDLIKDEKELLIEIIIFVTNYRFEKCKKTNKPKQS